jgi:hypothetical protein
VVTWIRGPKDGRIDAEGEQKETKEFVGSIILPTI